MSALQKFKTANLIGFPLLLSNQIMSPQPHVSRAPGPAGREKQKVLGTRLSPVSPDFSQMLTTLALFPEVSGVGSIRRVKTTWAFCLRMRHINQNSRSSQSRPQSPRYPCPAERETRGELSVHAVILWRMMNVSSMHFYFFVGEAVAIILSV